MTRLFKRPNALILQIEQDSLVFFNIFTKTAFSSNKTFDLIKLCADWVSVDEIHNKLPDYTLESIEKSVEQLIFLGALIEKDTPNAIRDEEFSANWKWGLPLAAFHFGAISQDFISAEDGHEILRERIIETPSPSLFTLNNPEKSIALPRRTGDQLAEPLLVALARRRSYREMYPGEPIHISEIADCLYYSMAITGKIDIPEIMDLPLKMTPSGGARNPYEAYLCAVNVIGLKPGIYHYSAIQHSLELVNTELPANLGSFLGDQDWVDDASAMIILVANFERTMWKYDDPNAYRVVMIESGHIGQNISLVATMHNLVGNPSALISRQVVEKYLKVDGITKAAIYGIVIGVPLEVPEDQRQEKNLDPLSFNVATQTES